jgi:hypothetical protein
MKRMATVPLWIWCQQAERGGTARLARPPKISAGSKPAGRVALHLPAPSYRQLNSSVTTDIRPTATLRMLEKMLTSMCRGKVLRMAVAPRPPADPTSG